MYSIFKYVLFLIEECLIVPTYYQNVLIWGLFIQNFNQDWKLQWSEIEKIKTSV